MDERERQAFKLVEHKTDRLLELFRMVVGVDTTVPPGRNYDVLIDRLEPIFAARGFATERVVIPPELLTAIPLPIDGPRVNLVATRSVGREPVTIYAHIDVVPVGDGWTQDPFGAELVEGNIYGRGTADMKGAIAALITAVEVLDELGIAPNYDLRICLCTDEEIGGYPGILHLARHGYVQGHMLCLDGGRDARLTLASAGAVDATITTHGRSAHSGMNYLGINAIDAMLPIMNELALLKSVVEARESTVPGPPHPQARSQQMTPMFNFAIIEAGVKSNIVPATCRLVINRRYIPEESFEQVTGEISAAVERGRAKSEALDVTVDFFHLYPAMRLNPDGVHTQKMKEAAKLVRRYRDEDYRLFGIAGSTDMANVQQELGWDDIPVRGPGGMDSRMHGADEFVRLEDVQAFVKELIHYLAF